MTKKNYQKPIEIDAHLKYRCPKCAYDHWISLIQAQTKNFKIVCDCKTVFQPRRIDKLKILYVKRVIQPSLITTVPEENAHVVNEITNEESLTKKETQNTIATVEEQHKVINKELRDKCAKILIQYGFTQSESRVLITDAYRLENIEDPILLVKKALSLIGDTNEQLPS